MSQHKFINEVLQAFRKIQREIYISTVEHDFRPRLADYFCEKVLAYEKIDIRYERGRTDLTLIDGDRNRSVIIETKRPNEDLDEERWHNQAFSYADPTTLFVVLTNGFRFLLYEIRRNEKELIVDINFRDILEDKKFSNENLSSLEVEKILRLSKISKNEIDNEQKYSNFNEYYGLIDISENDGFELLISQLDHIINNLLKQFAFNSFDEYYTRYQELQRSLRDLEDDEQSNSKENKSEVINARLIIQNRFKRFSSFSGYYEWRVLSGYKDENELKEDEREADYHKTKEIFCKESIYVLLNRLIFIRICEDKNLLKKRISDGGIEQFRSILEEDVIDNSDQIFKQIVFSSYSSARKIYSHIFDKGSPLDWYENGDGELNRVMNKILWILNRFNFSNINSDILGKIYEKYLPLEERKQLGEFYTPDSVIEYILDTIGYIPTNSIEDKKIIDPSCGSGGFLVKAIRRLIERWAIKFGKTTSEEIASMSNWTKVLERLEPKECEKIINSIISNIYGFDLNPFAVHITEMNILFQIVDLFQKAKSEGNASKFELKDFKIYQTDSLVKPEMQYDLFKFSGPTSVLLYDKAEIEKIKNTKFDFVVGNPPWLGSLKIKKLDKKLHEPYLTAQGKYDIYVLFIELGINMLSQNGKLGYIIQNRFLKASYAKTTRNFILKNTHIKQIINFLDGRIFKNAINYPAIISLQKVKDEENFFYLEYLGESRLSTDPFDELRDITLTKSQIKSERFGIVIQDQKNLTDDSWILITDKGIGVMNKIKSYRKLKDFCGNNIIQGVTIGFKGSDKVYYINKSRLPDFEGEERVLKNVIRGKNIKKFSFVSSNSLLIYPYDSKGTPIDIMTYPRIKRHLDPFKGKLLTRVLDGKTISEWNMKWFELWRKRDPSKFEKKKIICPRISKINKFALDEGGHYVSDSVVCMLIEEEYTKYTDLILAILNSKLTLWYIQKTSNLVQDKYYSYSEDYIKNIPIKIPSDSVEEVIFHRIRDNVKHIRENQENIMTGEMEVLYAEIDNHVFDLFGVDKLEREMIEKEVSVQLLQ